MSSCEGIQYSSVRSRGALQHSSFTAGGKAEDVCASSDGLVKIERKPKKQRRLRRRRRCGTTQAKRRTQNSNSSGRSGNNNDQSAIVEDDNTTAGGNRPAGYSYILFNRRIKAIMSNARKLQSTWRESVFLLFFLIFFLPRLRGLHVFACFGTTTAVCLLLTYSIAVRALHGDPPTSNQPLSTQHKT